MIKNYNKLNFIIMLILFIMTIISFFFLPNAVAIHSSFNGVDGYGSKYSNFLVPIIAFVLWIAEPAIDAKSIEKAKAGEYALGDYYLMKKRIKMNVLFIFLIAVDIYALSVEFQYSSNELSTNFWIYISAAILFVLVAAVLFLMTKKELFQLNWKELQPTDSESSLSIKRSLIAIGFLVLAALFILNAFSRTVSLIPCVIVLVLTFIKFIYGLFTKKNKRLIKL